ncbi:MAG: histidinol phosphate phosphatase domain-containing protein [Chloroflexi bacterium]|nr:histidinol phosphate phosphatase domain-containing protein [Chloroflexota bacterium]
MYDFHTHTFFSEGSLSPIELIRRARESGYAAIAITDHAGVGHLERLIKELTKDCAFASEHWGIIAVPGVELTHVPQKAIPEIAKRAKELGARLVIVHGETFVEPVEPGTNLSAVQSPHVDILAHPGILSLHEAQLAAANGIFLEVSARRGHSLANGHIVKVARLAGAKLIINSDAHEPQDLLTPALAQSIAQGAGLEREEIRTALESNPLTLLARMGFPVGDKP